MAQPRRPLTTDEARILGVLRDHYGPANNVDAVFFTDRDEAVIFAKDRNGVTGICVNLTVVPMMQHMEGVADADVFEKYLQPPGTIAVPRDASGTS
jgi:hypothetical protein